MNDTQQISQRLDIHNYLFFHMSKTDERNLKIKNEIFRDIRSITHVNDLLVDPATKKIATIPNSQIVAFQKMLNDGHYPVRFIPDMIAKGMKMRVKSGSLRGLEGTVETISEGVSDVYISLDKLGCAVVAIPSNQLELISPQKTDVNMSDWLPLHPYTMEQSVDKCYLAFANAFINKFNQYDWGVPLSNRRRMAVSLAVYLEDKRSRLGLFDYFVRMQYQGAIHPLQLLLPDQAEDVKKYMAGYDANGINAIDLMYFLLANDNGKQREWEKIKRKTSKLKDILMDMGCEKLPSNTGYRSSLFFMIQTDGLTGLTNFLSWVANCVNRYSYGKVPKPEATYIFSKCHNVEPLSYALQLSTKLKVKVAVTRLIDTMLKAPMKTYEVVGCYRKAIHLQSSDGIKHIVYLDKVSAGTYAVGEHYDCRLFELEPNKWYMVEPPTKSEEADDNSQTK